MGSREYFTLLLSENAQLQELYRNTAGKTLAAAELETLIDTLPMAAQYYEFDTPLTGADKTRIHRDMLLKWVRIQQHGKNLFCTGKFTGLTHFAVYGRGDQSYS